MTVYACEVKDIMCAIADRQTSFVLVQFLIQIYLSKFHTEDLDAGWQFEHGKCKWYVQMLSGSEFLLKLSQGYLDMGFLMVARELCWSISGHKRTIVEM